MEKERIRYLLRQFMNDVLSQEERRELSGILQEEPEQVQAVISEMMEGQPAAASFDKARWQGMLEKILAMDKPVERPSFDSLRDKPAVVRWLRSRWAAAAVILILIAGGASLWLNLWPAEERDQVTRRHADISPGGNKAVLTLEDGSRMVLDEVQEGKLLSRGSTVVNKTGDGELGYELASPIAIEDEQLPTAYHILSTPRGGQYRIVLPDGTRVWLNAASSLKYPTAFTGQERTVELSGEGYFEVTEDKYKPFRVKMTGGAAVEVLGTRFNIMAYQEEESMQTTLLEGSILVRAKSQEPGTKNQTIRNTKPSKLLKPGQQAQISQSEDKIRILEVNPEEAVAWKNGYFMFSGESIQSIMRKVARWYDVEIEYQGNITRERFGGTISRFENVSEVLDMLKLTGLVNFKVEERRIIVMP